LPRQRRPRFFSWSGFYLGFNSGYTWRGSGAFNTSAVNLLDASAIPGLPGLWGAASTRGAAGSVGARLNGFLAGGQLGYN
jgi:hypothetical protein